MSIRWTSIRLTLGAVLVLMAAAVSLAHAAAEEKRIALVIGITAYQHAPELVNSNNDAHAVGEALRSLKFEVTEKLDLDNRGFAEALREFGMNAAKADVAVLYYAGHGIQVDGNNYLIPADARLERERDLVYEAMPLNLPLGELAQARKIGILILDACRNNPFVDRLARVTDARRSVHAGLARVDDTPSDTLVAMATRADQFAEDGTGDHSPYAAALLEHLRTPGLELSLFFRNVRDTVRQATNGRQEPYIFGSLGAAPFYFNPSPPNRPPVLAAIRPIELFDRAEAEPLRIGQPSDPDGDDMVARIAGLPRGGSIQVGERIVLIGDYLTVEQLAAASFKPDASHQGDAGNFEFAILDGRGGSSPGSVHVTIKPSNRPPVVVAARTVKTVANPLGIEAPSDPDGDRLTITVTAVPERGKVKDGGNLVRPGDRLTLESLTALSFDPEQAPVGTAGVFSVLVEDGRDGKATASVTLEVAEPGAAPGAEPAEVTWSRIRTSTDTADFDAFLRLFGDSGYAPLARQQRERFAAATPAEEPATKEEPEKTVAAVEPVESGRYETTTVSNVRNEPNTSAAPVAQVDRGTVVQVLGRAPGADWLRVSLADGTQGFIYAPLVQLVPEPAEPEPQAEPPEPEPERQQVAAAVSPELSAPPAAATPNGTARTHGANGFRDCPDCPVMMRIPAGEFMMGENGGDGSARPIHRVTVAKPFALGVYEVTVGEWRACVDGGGCPEMPRMNAATDTTPVHNVHWEDAVAFTTWLSQKTGRRYRLPSEAEWEYAARAGADGHFWWGAAGGPQANCQDCGSPYERLRPVSIGSYEANPFGVHDMNGSVAEWVADCWNKDYRGAPSDASAWQDGNCRKRVLRGGSWRHPLPEISATSRLFYDADVRYLSNGLRVARDLN